VGGSGFGEVRMHRNLWHFCDMLADGEYQAVNLRVRLPGFEEYVYFDDEQSGVGVEAAGR
jgi:hypothetical protein